MEYIVKILNTVKIIDEPKVPFPQADSFERVINLCELLNEREHLNKEQITQQYDFDIRQTDYYTNAGIYLGLIYKGKSEGKVSYFLTETGKNLFEVPLSDRQLKFIESILAHRAFNETLKATFKQSEIPKKAVIVKIMQQSNLYNINELSTFERRSSTITSWLNWILDQIED